MLNQADSKKTNRGDGSGVISYKYSGAEQLYSGVCLNISGSGILFRAEKFIETGMALEITIERETALTASMIAYVEVIRSIEIASDQFEVTTEIKGIKENQVHG